MERHWSLMRKLTGLSAVVLGLASGHAAAAELAGDAQGYGLTRENPVELCRITSGSQLFSRLTCASGQRPVIQRRGSIGPRTPHPEYMSQDEAVRMVERAMAYEALEPGEPDRHILDAYEVGCGDTPVTLYVDVYHCRPPSQVPTPAGFSLAPYDPAAGALEAGRALVIAMGLDTRMERLANLVVGQSDAYPALASRHGEQKAAQLAREEIAKVVPQHLETLRREAALAYARHFSGEEMLSLVLDREKSPHAAKLHELQPRIAGELQGTIEPMVGRVVAEALRNAQARE